MLVYSSFFRILLLWCFLIHNSQRINAQSTPKESGIIERDIIAVCNLQVNAGPDVTICEPGGHIFLDGAVSAETVIFEWTPHTGLSDPFILDPDAYISDFITYVLTGWGIDPTFQNLVYNGDFSLGNTGITTDYMYVMDLPVVQNELYVDGTYTVVNDPTLVNDNWDDCDPSPVSGGNMMVINGVVPLDTFWCQTITVTPNTQYYFDGWLLSLVPQLTDLMFSFNGVTTPVIWYGAIPCNWIQLSYPPYTTWFSGDTTSVEICVLCGNFGGGQIPLEIAFDDFSLVELCAVTDSVSIFITDDVAPVPEIIGPVEVCNGDNITYTVDFPAGTEIISYAWTVSPTGTIITGQGTEQITVHWNAAGTGNVCLTINTFCHSNEGCTLISIGDVPPDVEITGPLFLCPGEMATLTVPITSFENEYLWNVPPEIEIIGGQGTNSIVIQWGSLDETTICIDISNECGTTSDCIDISKFSGYVILLDLILCEGEVVEINGTEYGDDLLFGTEFFTTANGCDSTVEIQITLETPVVHNANVILCAGDSIFLQGAYQTLPGTYTDTYAASGACDSIVNSNVTLTFPDTTWTSSVTCDTALAGTTISTYTQTDCDSIVVDFVTWVPGDSTFISLFSCNPQDTGQTQEVLQNLYGCDSIINRDVFFIPPDSTFIHQTSCDSASLGVFELHFNSINGCDSTVITTVDYSAQDSTLINGSSCNPADVGTFIQMLTNGFGCDSIVITTVSLLLSNESFITSSTCDPAGAGNFDHLLVNQFGCDSIVHETVSLLPSSETFLFSSTCTSAEAGTFVNMLQNQFGCDSIVTLTVSLVPVDTTQLISKTCDPAQVGSTQNTFTNQDGCDSLVIQTTVLFPLPQLNVQVTSEFNGYAISCFGEADGSITANVTGIGPYQYFWSTGSPDQNVTGLSAGNYAVTITDGNGCVTQGSISMVEPEQFSIGLEVSQPDCFDHHVGGISVLQSGGVHPVRYSIDGINFQASPVFNGLSDGAYTIAALDANDCEVKEIVWINVPLAVNVELGDDMTILPGDTTVIEAIVNVPFDSLVHIVWSGITNPNCPTCLTQSVAPIITTAYSISVSNSHGCSDSDTIIISVEEKTDIYIPNIFSPNGDGINDQLLISTVSDVEEIESMMIFDRWGNVVYTAERFLPGDPAYSWDGKMRSTEMNPAVYGYRLITRFKDGRKEIRNGDITLIR